MKAGTAVLVPLAFVFVGGAIVIALLAWLFEAMGDNQKTMLESQTKTCAAPRRCETKRTIVRAGETLYGACTGAPYETGDVVFIEDTLSPLVRRVTSIGDANVEVESPQGPIETIDRKRVIGPTCVAERK